MFDDFEPANNSPKILDHDLNKYFPELLKFNSLEETEKSAVYQKIKPTVERILNAIVSENFSDSQNHLRSMTQNRQNRFKTRLYLSRPLRRRY